MQRPLESKDIDEYETVVDIYDTAAPGSAVRLFEVIAEGVEQKVTLFAPDDTDVVASSENGIVEWRMSREEALRMGMQN